MPNATVEISQYIVDDANPYVGNDKKFVSFYDAVKASLGKIMDDLDEVDKRKERLQN